MKCISDQIADVAELPRSELVELWIRTHKAPPPKGVGRRLLELSAAHSIQSSIFGRLDRNTKRALMAATPKGGDSCKAAVTQQWSAKTMNPGSRLVRVWNGKTHQVEVLEKGFIWNERRFRSLSAIAREITGARWSGPRFFGL